MSRLIAYEYASTLRSAGRNEVDDPAEPDGDGWELVTTAAITGEMGHTLIDTWRRQIKRQSQLAAEKMVVTESSKR